jgi:hypothetical protein
MIQQKTLASEEAGYSNDAAAKKKLLISHGTSTVPSHFIDARGERRDRKVEDFWGMSRTNFNKITLHLPALKAPADASPGQRPEFRHRPNVSRPEGAQGPSAPSGRTSSLGASLPGRCPGLATSAPLARHNRVPGSLGGPPSRSDNYGRSHMAFRP